MSKPLDDYTAADSSAFENSIHRGANGYWKPIYPSEVGRALKHVEADFNYKLLSGSLANYRIYPGGQLPSNYTNVEDFSNDENKYLTLKKDGTDFYWTVETVQGGNGSGDKGAKGQKGQTGATGTTGEAGADGADGAKGQKGARGTSGTVGAKGQKGQKGARGASGVAGLGITTDDGDDTPAQKFGSNSSNTFNGVEYGTFIGNAGDVYYWSGTQWNDAGMNIIGNGGEPGDKGQKGQTGATGAAGAGGATGQKGARGSSGTAGSKGAKGESGSGASLTYSELMIVNQNTALSSNHQYYVIWDTNFVPQLNFIFPASTTNGGTGGNIVEGDTIILKFVAIGNQDGEPVSANCDLLPESDNNGDPLEFYPDRLMGEQDILTLSVETRTCVVFTRTDDDWSSSWMIESKYL